MSFPQSPYNIRVGKVQVDSVDVSGAQFRLKNTTKSTETLKTSSETDSNITINLAECGDWNINDNLELVISYNGKVATGTHQVVAADNGRHDFGTVALLENVGRLVARGLADGGRLINGGMT